jgi:hypothetical protein
MHTAQKGQEAKSTPKLRDVKETNQECRFSTSTKIVLL